MRLGSADPPGDDGSALEESMRLLIEEGVDTFVEVGPGRVLVGLLRQIERSVGALNVEDEKSLSTTMDKIAQVPGPTPPKCSA